MEPGPLEAVVVVEGGAGDVLGAGRVNSHLDRAEPGLMILGVGVGVEENLVREPRAPAGLDGDAQGELVVALLGQQLGDLGGGDIGEVDDGCGMISVVLIAGQAPWG